MSLLGKRGDRPRVVANFAVTADGKISTRALTPSLFTSASDKRRLLEIRAKADAILVGRGTVAADSMTLGLPATDLQSERLARGQSRYPLRAIVSGRGGIDPSLRLFHSRGGPIHLFTTGRITAASRLALEPLCEIHEYGRRDLDLAQMLAILRKDHAVANIVCEGGARLFSSLLAIGAIDELNLTLAPCGFGGARAPTLGGVPGKAPIGTRGFRLAGVERSGGEFFLRYLARR